jgi:single-strand DNA-binding protein
MLPTIHGEFGVVAEPDLKFSQNGSAWLKLRGIAKDRVRDASGTWSDGDPLFIDIVCNQGAENLYESIAKGDTVIVSGKLKQREYEKDGDKRTVIEIRADSIGVSVRWGPARTQNAMQAAAAKPEDTAKDVLGATEIVQDAAPF